MTTHNHLTDRNESDGYVGDIATLAFDAADAKPLDFGELYLVRNDRGGWEPVRTQDDPNAEPIWKTSSQTVTDPESLIRYLEKHGDGENTELRVYQGRGEVVAHIDAGTHVLPGRDQHRVAFKPTPDPEWQRWAQIDGKLLEQEQFAELVEDMAATIIDPDAATMLEIAQSMQVNRSVQFEQAQRLQDGNVRFGWREDTEASAGAAGNLQIPALIELALTPFRGGQSYRVNAKLRWRIERKQLRIGIKLDRPDLIADAALQSMVDRIDAWNNEPRPTTETTETLQGNTLRQDTTLDETPRHLITYHA